MTLSSTRWTCRRPTLYAPYRRGWYFRSSVVVALDVHLAPPRYGPVFTSGFSPHVFPRLWPVHTAPTEMPKTYSIRDVLRKQTEQLTGSHVGKPINDIIAVTSKESLENILHLCDTSSVTSKLVQSSTVPKAPHGKLIINICRYSNNNDDDDYFYM